MCSKVPQFVIWSKIIWSEAGTTVINKLGPDEQLLERREFYIYI